MIICIHASIIVDTPLSGHLQSVLTVHISESRILSEWLWWWSHDLVVHYCFCRPWDPLVPCLVGLWHGLSLTTMAGRQL